MFSILKLAALIWHKVAAFGTWTYFVIFSAQKLSNWLQAIKHWCARADGWWLPSVFTWVFQTRAGNTSSTEPSTALVWCKSPWFHMIKRLCTFNNWLPLVKDLGAHRVPYHQRGANIFLILCQVSHKNISHIKLKVMRTRVLLHFSDIFFFKMAKQTKAKILVDIIKRTFFFFTRCQQFQFLNDIDLKSGIRSDFEITPT